MVPQDNKSESENNEFPVAEYCLYTKCYCEENVWKLCEKLKDLNSIHFDSSYAVFVINNASNIPLWHQRSGMGDDGFIIWDYHVFLASKCRTSESKIYDFDTRLDIPCSFLEYTERALRNEERFPCKYRRLFRVIPAGVYLSSFASDRSHMIKENGEYSAPPPQYPPIACEVSTNNIQEFLTADPAVGVGQILDYWQFIEFFCDN